MARTEKFHHPCPNDDCFGEVVLEYDAGRGREDFDLVPDEQDVRCDRNGCGPFPPEQFRRWWDQDVEEMGDRMYAKLEEARESHWEAKLERHRLKED